METKRYIYLDCAASAPLRKEARDAEEKLLALPFAKANPNSLHTLGREAARELDRARRTLARALGGGFRPMDIIFTSGGTESNNLAVLGLAEGIRARERSRCTVIISAIEHDSVLDLAQPLRDRGFTVRIVGCNKDGVVEPETLAGVLDESCAVVSVMAANNETGVVQPIDDLAVVAHGVGALFHTDAVQAFCKVPLNVIHVDALSFTGHKLGAPVGIGALAVRSRCPLRAQSYGGGQEGGRRSGTQDVVGAATLAAVVDAVSTQQEEVAKLIASRSERLCNQLLAGDTGIRLTTRDPHFGTTHLPGTLSLLVSGLDSETLIVRLDAEGFEVSAGSACSSGSLDPSHVLLAMGIPRDEAFGSLRVSFDERVSQEDLDCFAQALLRMTSELKRGGRR